MNMCKLKTCFRCLLKLNDIKGFVFTRFWVTFQKAEKPMLLHVALLSKSKSPELKNRVRNGKSVSKHMVPVLMIIITNHHQTDYKNLFMVPCIVTSSP